MDAGVPDDLLSEGSPSGTASTTPPRSTPTPARTTTPTVSREEAQPSTSSTRTTTTTMRTVDQNARVARAAAAAASASEVDPLRAVDRPRTTSVASAPATRATADAAHAVVAIATAGAVVAAVGATTAEAAEGPDAPRPATRLRTPGTIADTRRRGRAHPPRRGSDFSTNPPLPSHGPGPVPPAVTRASISRRVRPKFRDGRAQTIPPRYALPATSASRGARGRGDYLPLARAGATAVRGGPRRSRAPAAAAAHASSVPATKHALDALRSARGAIVRVGVGGAVPSRRTGRSARAGRSRRGRVQPVFRTPIAPVAFPSDPISSASCPTRPRRDTSGTRTWTRAWWGTSRARDPPSVGLRRRDRSRYARPDVSRR